MRKIIEYCLVSADGVFDHPDPLQMRVFDHHDEAYLRDSLALYMSCDALLFGRATYETFARIYSVPGGGNRAYAHRLNAMPKYVFSSTLETATWTHTTIVRGDLVAEVKKLKEQDGGNLLVLGHGQFGETLLKHRLLDLLDLAIHPVLVGQGRPLFRESLFDKGEAVQLELAAVKAFSKIVKLTYEPRYA